MASPLGLRLEQLLDAVDARVGRLLQFIQSAQRVAGALFDLLLALAGVVCGEQRYGLAQLVRGDFEQHMFLVFAEVNGFLGSAALFQFGGGQGARPADFEACDLLSCACHAARVEHAHR